MFAALGGLVLSFSACSGDDGDDKEKGKDAPSSTVSDDPKLEKKLVAKTVKCDADVSTSGAYDADWKGEATVRTGGHSIGASGPAAVYTLTDKNDNRVALYSPGNEFKGSISLFADGLSYSSDPADAESLDIDKRGRSASVDTTVTSISGDEIQLVAEFTCGKKK